MIRTHRDAGYARRQSTYLANKERVRALLARQTITTVQPRPAAPVAPPAPVPAPASTPAPVPVVQPSSPVSAPAKPAPAHAAPLTRAQKPRVPLGHR